MTNTYTVVSTDGEKLFSGYILAVEYAKEILEGGLWATRWFPIYGEDAICQYYYKHRHDALASKGPSVYIRTEKRTAV